MSKRILVVEDQPDNRQIIRDMLAPTDYEITEAENGEEALTAIAKQRPDLILMDIQLPIMDGYAATRKLSFSAILCAGTAVRENNRYHWHGECRARRWAPIFRPTVTTGLLCEPYKKNSPGSSCLPARMRVGLYRPVHVKTLRSQKRRVAPSTLPKTISERFPAASTLPSIRARRRLNCAPACSSPPLCRDGRRSKKQSICTGLSTVGLPRALKRQTSCKQGRCLASCDNQRT
jgi:hypothetical protein